MNYFKKFGYCVVPKNTFLYRGHVSAQYADCMYFALTPDIAKLFNREVQVWRVKKAFKIIFLIESINSSCQAISAIPHLINDLYSIKEHKIQDDLKLKEWIKNNTSNFISKFSLSGWLTSLENNNVLEVCLINSVFIQKHIELQSVIQDQSDILYRNSLRRFKIYPSIKFYQKSRKKIESHSIANSNYISTYSKHCMKIRSWIKENSNSDSDVSYFKEYYYDLRQKLKI